MVRAIISKSQKQAIAVLFIGMAYWKLTRHFQWAIPCPFRWRWDIPCPGCGMGRACMRLLNGRFEYAWQMHWGVYILAFYITYSLLPRSVKRFVQSKTPKYLKTSLGIFVLTALLVRWGMVLLGHVCV